MVHGQWLMAGCSGDGLIARWSGDDGSGKMRAMRPAARAASGLVVAALLFAIPVGVATQTPAPAVHSRAIVIDTHADTTQRMIFDPRFNIGERHSDGNVDIPRM